MTIEIIDTKPLALAYFRAKGEARKAAKSELDAVNAENADKLTTIITAIASGEKSIAYGENWCITKSTKNNVLQYTAFVAGVPCWDCQFITAKELKNSATIKGVVTVE